MVNAIIGVQNTDRKKGQATYNLTSTNDSASQPRDLHLLCDVG